MTGHTPSYAEANKMKSLTLHSFIHSYPFYSASSSSLLLRRSRHSKDTVLEFHAEAPQAIVS